MEAIRPGGRWNEPLTKGDFYILLLEVKRNGYAAMCLGIFGVIFGAIVCAIDWFLNDEWLRVSYAVGLIVICVLFIKAGCGYFGECQKEIDKLRELMEGRDEGFIE